VCHRYLFRVAPLSITFNSLLRWLALWAAGWHWTVTWYHTRICKIISAMPPLMQFVKPSNMQAVGAYFAGPEIKDIGKLLYFTTPAQSTTSNDSWVTYMNSEEQKLRNQLEVFGWKLNNVATLRRITGTSHPEHVSGLPRVLHLLPVLYFQSSIYTHYFTSYFCATSTSCDWRVFISLIKMSLTRCASRWPPYSRPSRIGEGTSEVRI
jgi:hypothetical protein